MPILDGETSLQPLCPKRGRQPGRAASRRRRSCIGATRKEKKDEAAHSGAGVVCVAYYVSGLPTYVGPGRISNRLHTNLARW
jgi:hypothetical protein